MCHGWPVYHSSESSVQVVISFVQKVQGRVQLATFQKEEAQKAEQLGWRNLSDFTIRRQFQLLTNIGPSAMRDPAKFEKVSGLVSDWILTSCQPHKVI